MKNLRLTLALTAAALFVPLAYSHPLLAVLLFITCAGAFMPAGFVLRENRLGTSTITLSGVTELLYKARAKVARECVGFLPAVMVNADSIGVSKNGTVKSVRTSEPTLNTSYTPAMTIPEGDAQTTSVDSLTLDQVANVQIPLEGEACQQLINTVGIEAAFEQLFSRAIRKIVNAQEVFLGTTLKNGGSRAIGTSGTTPFASSHALLLQAHQILKDNGTPNDGDTSLVLSTSAETNLKSLSNLFKANEAGTDDILRRGILGNLDNVNLRASAGVATTTAGTMASATSTSAAFTVGQTVIPLAAAGTGVVAAGDVITFANDTNQYVVASVSFAGANPASGDSITLASPGLRLAQGVATRAITVTAAYTANSMFHRSAVEFAVRPPALPVNPVSGSRQDAAQARMTLVDPISGMAIGVAVFLGYYKNMVDMTSLYGAKVWNPEFVATLKG